MRSKLLPTLFAALVGVLLIAGSIYTYIAQKKAQPVSDTPVATASVAVSASPSVLPSGAPSPDVSPSVLVSPIAAAAAAVVPAGANAKVDLTVDTNGLSRTTAVITTPQGIIKFKFYPQDAPNTVNRVVELIGKGFYDGLTFHRVVPGFVIQGGDPVGNGTGGSGQKLKAEFNNRRHVEGTVAMARAQDPDSADSQFYISLGTLPHLDHNYTVFGQVTEGMDVARKIKVGDKMTSVRLE